MERWVRWIEGPADGSLDHGRFNWISGRGKDEPWLRSEVRKESEELPAISGRCFLSEVPRDLIGILMEIFLLPSPPRSTFQQSALQAGPSSHSGPNETWQNTKSFVITFSPAPRVPERGGGTAETAG